MGHSFQLVTSLDEALCHPAGKAGQTAEQNVINDERDGSAEFSDLYVRLLSAALDATSSSLSPRMRGRYLAAHVARGILMTGIASESFSQSRTVRNKELRHGATPVL